MDEGNLSVLSETCQDLPILSPTFISKLFVLFILFLGFITHLSFSRKLKARYIETTIGPSNIQTINIYNLNQFKTIYINIPKIIS